MRRPSLVQLSLHRVSSLTSNRTFTGRTHNSILSGFSSLVSQSAAPAPRRTPTDQSKNDLYFNPQRQRQDPLRHKHSNQRKYSSTLEPTKTNISFSNDLVEIHEGVAIDTRGPNSTVLEESIRGSPNLTTSNSSDFIIPVKFSKARDRTSDWTPDLPANLPPSALRDLEVQQQEIREMFQRRPYISVKERKKDPKTNQYIVVQHEIPLLPVEYLKSKYYRPFLQREIGKKFNSTLSLMLSSEERLHYITQLNKLAAIENTMLPFRCLRCFSIFDAIPKKVLMNQVGPLSAMDAMKEAQESQSGVAPQSALERQSATGLEGGPNERPPGYLMRMKKRKHEMSKLRPDEADQFGRNGRTSTNVSGCPKCGSNVQWLMEYQHRKTHTIRKK